jgi:HEAT repeat protein
MKKMTILVLLFVLFSPFLFAGEKLSTDELVANLKANDARVREDAAKELGDRGEKLGLDALIQATSDKDENVQLAAVKALGQINDPRQVTALSQAIRNSQGKAQKEAIHELTEHYIPSRDMNALQELWGTIGKLFNPPHPIIAEPWIKVDPEAIDAIVFVLDDKNSVNRLEAAATLGILRAAPALPRLVFYLKSPNDSVVQTCVRSIGYIGKPEAGADLVPLLKHQDKEVVMDTVRVLGQFRYQPALPELQHFLDYTNDQEYRRVALQAISRIGDPSSEPTIRKYLTSDDKELRQYAIEGVGRIGLQGYRESLQRDFQRESSKQIKLALCFSLFALGDRAYIDTLVRSLDERMYRDQVREYFMELGTAAVPEMANYLRGSEKDYKVKIIRMLGDMHQPKAIEILEPYLKDQDLEIAQAATDAIRELKQVQSV